DAITQGEQRSRRLEHPGSRQGMPERALDGRDRRATPAGDEERLQGAHLREIGRRDAGRVRGHVRQVARVEPGVVERRDGGVQEGAPARARVADVGRPVAAEPEAEELAVYASPSAERV